MMSSLFNTSAACIWAAGLLFGIAHSLLATRVCRDRSSRLGIAPTAYRLGYSLLATLLTGLWLWLVYTLPDAPLYAVTGTARISLIAVQVLGGIVVLASLRAFDAAIFLGFKPMPATGEPFVEGGIYRYLRHPMYTGFMLLLLASPVHTTNSLHFALAVSAYFLIGSRFEERRMLAIHPAYADYRRRVPAFLPRVALFRAGGTAQ